ncbi:MAG: glycosyltransferase family 39 protein [Phycisphaerae bacterium]|nr:glycosyltransferase family 39 protein [Phycisphaerae bacterium]
MTARKNRKKPKPASEKIRREPHSQVSMLSLRRLLPAFGVAGLLAIHFVLSYTSIRGKCTTYDEVAHLTKGYAWWLLDDKRLVPEHPPLAQAWAALPLLDDGLEFPTLDQKAWYQSHAFAIGKQFFYRVGNDPDAMLRQARMMIVLLSVALGGVVFGWSRHLFGTAGGFISLILYAFSPTVLAHSRLVTTDMVVSLCFLLSTGSIWWMLHRVSPVSVLAGAAALAGLFLSKMSAVLIVPMGMVLMLIRLLSGKPLPIRLGRERRVIQRWKMALVFGVVLVVFVLLVWLALWATFDFRYEAMVDAEPGRDRFVGPSPLPEGETMWEYQGRGIPTTAAAIDWARRRHLLPEAYLYGFLYTIQSARGRDAFLDGERSMTGWWHYFLYCFLYKVPLPIMGVLVLAVVAFASRRAWGRGVLTGLYRTAPLWVLIAVYWAFAMRSNLNIGHRHILPTFAPMFVLCGAATGWFKVTPKWLRAVVPGLLVLLVVTSLKSWPHYLAYFNSIAGGPSNGYRHLVQSSLDWGQDLPGLKRWLDGNRGDQRVYLAYHGTGDRKHYGIKAYPLPAGLSKSGTGDYTLKAGIYCISATRLQQIYMLKSSRWTESMERQYRRLLPEMRQFEQTPNNKQARGALLKSKGFKGRFKSFQKLRFGRLCAYLRQRGPDDQVGYSILIYRLADEEINRALYDPLPSP